jgi:hypothetical protein
MAAPKLMPACWRVTIAGSVRSISSRFVFSRIATYSISGVTMPRRA